jgi:hypothetical protein
VIGPEGVVDTSAWITAACRKQDIRFGGRLSRLSPETAPSSPTRLVHPDPLGFLSLHRPTRYRSKAQPVSPPISQFQIRTPAASYKVVSWRRRRRRHGRETHQGPVPTAPAHDRDSPDRVFCLVVMCIWPARSHNGRSATTSLAVLEAIVNLPFRSRIAVPRQDLGAVLGLSPKQQ